MSNDLQKTAELYRASWHQELSNGDTVVVVDLAYHVALYINLGSDGSYKDRFCMANLELAQKAAMEYAETGEMRYWQKWHNQNLSCLDGFVYKSGSHMIPENALYQVDWDSEVLSEEYPYKNPSLATFLQQS